jgi:hypothetical protein
VSEGQWFYEKGLRLRLRGDEEAARRVWRSLVAAYAGVPAERPWVRRAEKELDGKGFQPNGKELQSVREAAARARALEGQGKKDEAAALRRGLEQLYADDPAAMAIIRGQ